MDNANKRNKALDNETWLRSAIAALGVGRVADVVGVDKSQISRWQSGEDSMIAKIGRLLEAVNWDCPAETVIIHGEETQQIAKALAEMLEHLRLPGRQTGQLNEPHKFKRNIRPGTGVHKTGLFTTCGAARRKRSV